MRLSTFFFTIIYLKPRQVFYRIYRHLITPTIKSKVNFEVRINQYPLKPFPLSHSNSEYCLPDMFSFLQISQKIDGLNEWNIKTVPRLWLYQLHYFNYIHEIDHHDAEHVMLQWIKNNPIGKGTGWEAYPLSQRIVNWIKWLSKETKLNYNLDITSSLHIQTQFLFQTLEYHLLGNHLLANAKALLFSACFFKDKQANAWYEKGKAIFIEQVTEQILADGGHFERSPMYHAKILHDMLDTYNILQVAEMPIQEINWKALIEKMLMFLKQMTFPDGKVAYFNDTVEGVEEQYSELCHYACALGLVGESATEQSSFFPDAGFVRLQNDDAILIADIGSIAPAYLPGHAHAETLAFELAYLKQRVLVNTGVTTYEVGEIRDYERSTPAHNTLTIDHANSSQVWKAFRVAKRAKVISRQVDINQLSLQATHDGYRKILGNNLLHQRTLQLKQDHLIIQDKLTGSGEHTVNIYFHFAPSVNVELVEGNKLIIKLNDHTLILLIDNQLKPQIIEGYYALGFGRKALNQTIILKGRFIFPVEFKSVVSWSES